MKRLELMERSSISTSLPPLIPVALFQHSIIDHPIKGKLAVDQTGADIFIEHLLNARDGNGKIRSQTGRV